MTSIICPTNGARSRRSSQPEVLLSEAAHGQRDYRNHRENYQAKNGNYEQQAGTVLMIEGWIRVAGHSGHELRNKANKKKERAIHQ